jgi:mono/diheme cytochrome c family protein
MIVRRCVLASLLAWLICTGTCAAQDAVQRGEYLVHVGGCISCHTVPGGTPFAGGRGLATPFGTFYSPNITPETGTGIGGWTDAQFLRALREGKRPDGANYFPVFPYTSFTNITDSDALAIKAYLFSLKPAHQVNRAHDVAFPFSWRFLQFGWRMLFFREGPFRPDPAHDAAYNRGAYLVTALAHCGECHTPRNSLGGLRSSLALSGTRDGPDGQAVPNITPDRKTGIGDWETDDIVTLLQTGRTPEESSVTGAMREAVRDGLHFLTDQDAHAIAAYLQGQQPIAHKVGG